MRQAAAGTSSSEPIGSPSEILAARTRREPRRRRRRRRRRAGGAAADARRRPGLMRAFIRRGFRDFILQGNVVSLAVAVVVGSSFNALASGAHLGVGICRRWPPPRRFEPIGHFDLLVPRRSMPLSQTGSPRSSVRAGAVVGRLDCSAAWPAHGRRHAAHSRTNDVPAPAQACSSRAAASSPSSRSKSTAACSSMGE
jgi:hypothetical protein